MSSFWLETVAAWVENVLIAINIKATKISRG
jgi:hypothetical protein